jgi:hypothetical protein
MGRWQARMELKQSFLGRIVDIGAELFAMSSAVVYAHTMGSEHPERAEQAVELADLFCRQARRRVDALFTALWANDDDEDHATAQTVLDGRFLWLEDGVPDPSEAGLSARRARPGPGTRAARG